MTTKELIALMSDSKIKMMKAEQLQAVLKKKLDVKEYISIKDKKRLIDAIVNECILYEDGIFKFDNIDKYICFTMRAIELYTNIELSDDIEDDYDLLCQNGLLNSVIDTFIGEYENIKVLFQMKCDYVIAGNAVEAQFGRFFDNILDKMDTIVGTLSDKISGFDMENLPANMEDINKLITLIGDKNNK